MAHSFWTQAIGLQVIMIAAGVQGTVEKVLSPECREFVYMGVPPTGLDHHSLRSICQHYNSRARYLTLYNVVDRVPVYSAYTFKRSDGEKRMDVPWMYEPQVKQI